ncbi:MAG: hypothetical protein ACPLZY_03925, partial [Candidatus Norongarragalinales archaeon]
MSKMQKNPLILILLLGSLLVLSMFSISRKPSEQYAVINGQKIPLSAIPEGWDLASITPLQISLTTWEFYMRDIKTGLGIPDVHIF